MSDELLNAIAAEATETVDLVDLRKKVVELRDQYQLKAELEERLKKVSSQIIRTERDELPDMFSKAKISSLTVEAIGNNPAFIAERKTVYSAKIPDERRLDAFEWLIENGYGDLIKSNINIVFGMGQHEKRLETMKLLDSHGIDYNTYESVHHMTLKAQVKKWLQEGEIIPMDLLGAYIFDEIKIK